MWYKIDFQVPKQQKKKKSHTKQVIIIDKIKMLSKHKQITNMLSVLALTHFAYTSNHSFILKKLQCLHRLYCVEYGSSSAFEPHYLKYNMTKTIQSLYNFSYEVVMKGIGMSNYFGMRKFKECFK